MYEAYFPHASFNPGIVGLQIVAPEFRLDIARRTPLPFARLKGERSVFFHHP
jgi:hypothetical protein